MLLLFYVNALHLHITSTHCTFRDCIAIDMMIKKKKIKLVVKGSFYAE